MDCSPLNSPVQNTGMGSRSLLQGVFPTQESNPGLTHCRQIPYQLSNKGSPRILEWVAYPFYSGSSWPSNWTEVSPIAGGFFTNWAISKPLISGKALGGHKQNFACTRSQETKSVSPQETESDLPVSVQESSGQTTRRKHSLIHHQKIRLKIYWEMFQPSEQDPVSPTVSLFHQEASMSLLSLYIEGRETENHNHRKLTKMITWTTTLSKSIEIWTVPNRANPRQMGHGGEFWQNVVYWRREWQPTSVFMLWNSMNSMKGQKRYDAERLNSQVSRYPICYWQNWRK